LRVHCLEIQLYREMLVFLLHLWYKMLALHPGLFVLQDWSCLV
jgi:hypothetical protein